MSDEAKRIVEAETWEADRRGRVVSSKRYRPYLCATWATWATMEHATIAACAPEALRMLAKWEASRDIPCPECRQLDHEQPRHLDDCGWLALMKKAGLR